MRFENVKFGKKYYGFRLEFAVAILNSLKVNKVNSFSNMAKVL